MRVGCKTCGAAVDLPPGTDPHAITWCGCCTLSHRHGEAAAACGPDNHDGPCWNPYVAGIHTDLQPDAVPVRPPGCTVCRPIAHYPVAGSTA